MPKPDWAERLQRTFSRKFEAGRKAERERIIKLLEAEMDRIEKWTDYPATNSLANIRAALIKGENK